MTLLLLQPAWGGGGRGGGGGGGHNTKLGYTYAHPHTSHTLCSIWSNTRDNLKAYHLREGTHTT